MVTLGFEVDLDVSYAPGKPITFYWHLVGGRQIGHIPTSAPEYALAERAIHEYKALKPPPDTLAGAAPCRMALTEQRARELVSIGHTWGQFARRSSTV